MEQQSIKFDVDVVAKNTHQTQTKPSVFFFISLQFLYLLHRMFTDTHGTSLTLCLQSIWRNRVCVLTEKTESSIYNRKTTSPTTATEAVATIEAIVRKVEIYIDM